MATPSSTDQLKSPGASRRRAFLIGAVEPLLFLITAAVATAVGASFIADPYAVHINAKGPWLYALGILIAFTAYGALTSLTDTLLCRRGDRADSETETQS